MATLREINDARTTVLDAAKAAHLVERLNVDDPTAVYAVVKIGDGKAKISVTENGKTLYL
jgi:hypothetical protein